MNDSIPYNKLIIIDKCVGDRVRKLCDNLYCKSCFERSFASYEKRDYWSSENPLKPRYVTKMSNKKVIFNCDKCAHQFSKAPGTVCGENGWCPYCARQKLCDKDDCEDCKAKSFASSPWAKFWITDKNTQSPREVFRYTMKKYYFKCPECEHEFEKNLSDLKRKSFCSFCANKRICQVPCTICFEKSIASTDIVELWSVKNVLKVYQVQKGSSSIKFYFNCDKCPHDFEATVYNLLQSRKSIQGNGCPYCAHFKLCDNNECQLCLNNSFESSTNKHLWATTNTVPPRQVFKSSHYHYDFCCDVCKETFKASPANVNKGHKCPNCKFKTEKLVCDFLRLSHEIVREKTFPWTLNPETGGYRRYDVYIEKLNILIEIDGGQHFKQVMNWKDYKIIQKLDKLKNKWAIENNLSIIRIRQIDIYLDKIDWKAALTQELYIRDKPTEIFICKNNEYAHMTENDGLENLCDENERKHPKVEEIFGEIIFDDEIYEDEIY